MTVISFENGMKVLKNIELSKIYLETHPRASYAFYEEVKKKWSINIKKKIKWKQKINFFYKNLKDEPELNNFDVDEVYFDEIIDEEDQSTTQKIRNEKTIILLTLLT